MWTCRCENRRAEDCESTVRIAALVEQVENLTKERNDLQDKCNNFQTKCRTAITERDEYKKDAMRYRWFRDKGLWDADAFPFPTGFEFVDAVCDDQGLMLDAAIDAARGEVK